MSNKPVKYDFTKAGIKRVRAGKVLLESFHMREVDGRDEEMAANWAKSKGGSASSTEELVRLAIVAVNGQAVTQPYLQFDAWNQRARSFALRAFNDLNAFTEEEKVGFLATASEEDAPVSSPPAAPSGND